MLLHKIYQLVPTQFRRSLFWVLVLAVFAGFFELLGLGLVIPALAALTGDLPNLLSHFNVNLLDQDHAWLVVLMTLLLVYLFKSSYMLYVVYLQNRFAFKLQASISKEIFLRYLRKDYLFHASKNSSELTSHIVNEVNEFIYSAVIPLITLITEALIVISILGLLLVIQPITTFFVTFLFSLMGYVFYRSTSAYLEALGIERQTLDVEKLKIINKGFGAIREVKIHALEKKYISEFSSCANQLAKSSSARLTILLAPRYLVELSAVIAVVLIVLIMVYLQDVPKNSVLPFVGLFGAAAFRLTPSVNKILVSFQTVKYGINSTKLLGSLLAEIRCAPAPVASGSVSKMSFSDRISLRNLSFTYPGKKSEAVKKLSFDIPIGSRVGIYGPSGVGKSTVLDLILGLLGPDSGGVYIDNAPLSSDEIISAWHEIIGYVPQNIYLVDGTIAENIAFGSSMFDFERISNVIKSALLTEFIEGLPDGINTQVGERGVKLSGGQRQRIAIARALYRDPQVLVLDEATSALDYETEHEVMGFIRGLSKQVTILIVAHRLKTLENCDLFLNLKASGDYQVHYDYKSIATS